MQMSYGASIKLESIIGLERTLSLPQIWKLKFTLCVSKSKDKKENVTLKGKTMWKSAL